MESELWRQSVLVYDLTGQGIRLDSTTSNGYHSPGRHGVMQLGYRKDQRRLDKAWQWDKIFL